MASYLRLRVRELLTEHGTNLHKAMQAGGFSYPTMHRYMAYPDQVESLHTPSVLALLIDALGYDPESLEALPLGLFFEVVTEEPRPAVDWLHFHLRLLDSYLGHIRELDDPQIDQMVEAMTERLEYLAEERENGPAPPDELRAYVARVVMERLGFWIDYGAAELGEDEEIRALVEAGFARLREIAGLEEEEE